jgi:tellurite resistance-related uncharacterized protein
MMSSLPSNVVKYSQLPHPSKPPFAATTIPKGLLNRHNTKAGTWGVISIKRGTLRYVIEEGDRAGSYLLDKDTPGIIEPQVYHHIEPMDADLSKERDPSTDGMAEESLQFVVEFYRVPGTGIVDEKRE